MLVRQNGVTFHGTGSSGVLKYSRSKFALHQVAEIFFKQEVPVQLVLVTELHRLLLQQEVDLVVTEQHRPCRLYQPVLVIKNNS